MQQLRATGRNAAALKYDLLTAMGAYALAEGKGPQRLVLRLMTLVTARYNWVRNELCVGQREIARLWSVDERTVKREMAKLRAMGWLVVTRQGARGRVTQYRMDIEKILRSTRDSWAAIGPDYEQRMTRDEVKDDNVVPLPVGRGPSGGAGAADASPPDMSDGTEWGTVQTLLHSEDQTLFNAWFRALSRRGREGGKLILHAPSRFHADYVDTHFRARLLYACQSIDSSVDELAIRH
ncbi:DnaA N-terminal domain-containing protein [uncultured Aliiroseovarius sp.]|uniref:DnaA N-terminal domain-containing protein n=1 Tax=uncultured Aliiroseovarius sp. TaxID=1658783 RepID=UPI00259325E2|nr:DnaA N-terminal domain-containing protein [uncultured Aliiroseovarius sp.]